MLFQKEKGPKKVVVSSEKYKSRFRECLVKLSLLFFIKVSAYTSFCQWVPNYFKLCIRLDEMSRKGRKNTSQTWKKFEEDK